MPAIAIPEHVELYEAASCMLAKERQAQYGQRDAGFDAEIWKKLSSIGIPALGLPHTKGGSLSAACLVAETCGRHLAPVPVVESCAAARLLARFPNSPRAADIEDGSRIATLALRPAQRGVNSLVPAGAVAHVIVSLDGDELVANEHDDGLFRQSLSNTADFPLCDHRTDEGQRRILASGAEAYHAYWRAVAEWKTLAASLLAGIAARSLEIGVDYASQRIQFDVPIGSFQTIQHRLADIATEVDGAELLAAKAAWCFDHDVANAGVIASMAYAYCGTVAQRSAGTSLHIHGGYGFSLESAIQHYFRWAKGWTVLAGDPTQEYQCIAKALIADPGMSHGL